MIFTSYWFFAFAAILFPLYWLLPWGRARLGLLLVGCAIFHGHFAGAAGVIPIVVLAVATYLAGRSGRSSWCIATITLCVASLGIYKYSPFFVGSAVGLFDPQLAARCALWIRQVLPTTPPLAISFFTFEFVHYLYDVRKGRMRITSPVDFALFTIFFPSLVAGPIKRCGDFLPALHRGVAAVATADVAIGLSRVAIGFAKKVLISDNLAAVINYYAPHFTQHSLGTRWLLFAAIAFRILLDFSGYSDIAIGLARMFGITLPENFRWPYLASSLQEFWQRWHISLSTWIRDYIYIPLGGSRHGVGRKIANGFIVFALCGLWHGAAWNFIVWGVFHGAGLAICGNYRLLLGGAGAQIGAFFDRFQPLSWALTTGYVWLGWLLFFYPLPQAYKMAVSLLSR
ncbi:MAG TPA: MBOAT family O-acyltransferase [Chthoniobacter sp.]|nr:MBOAT family O-acyltransferase [Chthoniobacter sp.]